MSIRDYAVDEARRQFVQSDSVDAAVIEKYRRELAEDYKKFIVIDRDRIAKTAELSRTIVIA